MDYKECLEFLYEKLPMFSRVGPAALKPGLSNTLKLCAALDNPQYKFKSIHIAGTNGKGSVSHMMASILQSAGYKTGLYTSPHLVDFRERIRINGSMISEEKVIAFTEQMKELIEAEAFSFFELTVGMAFQYFATEQIDIAVIETGLGGRLDSTNVIQPELSVITNIGLEHTQLLGDTVAKIAFEKAGIIKPATPVVIGRTCPESKPVFVQKASEEDAPLVLAENSFHIEISQASPAMLILDAVNKKDGTVSTIEVDLAGLYQTENVRTVLCAIDKLNQLGWKILPAHVAAGLRNTMVNTGLRGRWELLRASPLLILDVAHNTDGINKLREQLETVAYRKLFIILGMSKEKDIQAILSLLPQKAVYGFTQAHIPRALEAGELANMAAEKNLGGHVFGDVNEAIETYLNQANEQDLIMVCGSVFVVGEVDRTRFAQ